MPDTTPPITTHDYDGSIKNSDFAINLAATDAGGSGISDTFYRINFGPILRVSINGQPTIDIESFDTILEFWSRDNDGNQELVKTVTQIKLDKTSPFEVTDTSGLNGTTLLSSQSRQISIFVQDGRLLANTITLNFIREGMDLVAQTLDLQLDVSGSSGTYTGMLNENPDPENIDVTNIKFWITGFDAAGNAIIIGGDESSPLTQYTIDDQTPIFKHVYIENKRIGQTRTVQNLGFASTYINGQISTLEITLNKNSFVVSADFSGIDSHYIAGKEIVENLGGGRYSISYSVSESNSLNVTNSVITITAKNGSHSASDTSFLASTTTSLSVVSIQPGHRVNNIHIDAPFVLQFNAELVDDGLLTGHIYITDSNGSGVPIDIDIVNNTAIITPIFRLKPSTTYVVHVNPDMPSPSVAFVGHYNEIIFTTGQFYIPLVPAGYIVTNAIDNSLTIADSSMKLSNNEGMSITWPSISNSVINGADLRDYPVMVSGKDSATIWAKNLDPNFANVSSIISIANLTGVVTPKVENSEQNTLGILAGLIFDETINSFSFSGNTLTITVASMRSIFVTNAVHPVIVTDGQNQFVRLSWCLPKDADFGYAILIKKIGSFPANPADGTILYQGTQKVWYDVGIPNGATQFYRLFVFDNQGRLYNYVNNINGTAAFEYRISYDYGKYEHKLMKQLGRRLACNQHVYLCDNAVADIANNGNAYTDSIPMFNEFRLGKNPLDKTNLIVSFCSNSITIELDPSIAFHIKDHENIFVICENETAKDAASNSSNIAMFTDIYQTPEDNEFQLLHTTPIFEK